MSPDIPHPRQAVVREANAGDEHAGFWRVLYYAGITVLVQGRSGQAIDALQAIVTRSDATP